MKRLFPILIVLLIAIIYANAVDPGVGELVINEILVGPGDTYEGSEYMELYNTTAGVLDLENVYIGGTEYDGICGGEDIWKFPTGATIAANGYVVIVKDVEDGDGFCDIFTSQCGTYSYIYELYDSDRTFEVDSANVPNMLLATTNDTGNDDQMGYCGGSRGYGASCGGTYNYLEAYYLRVGGTAGTIIDAVSYGNNTCASGDFCSSSPR